VGEKVTRNKPCDVEPQPAKSSPCERYGLLEPRAGFLVRLTGATLLWSALFVSFNGTCAPLSKAGISRWSINLALAQEQGGDADVPPSESQPSHRSSRHRRGSSSTPNEDLSRGLTDYLHQHRLPYVDAMVFASHRGRPTSISLSGEVRTERGRDDAEVKAQDFLGHLDLPVENHIAIDPSLGLIPPAAGSAPQPKPAAGDASSAQGGACADLCRRDAMHCRNHCHNQAYGNAPDMSSVAGMISQMGQTAVQHNDCTEDCEQTLDHCVYECSQEGASDRPPSTVDQPEDSGSNQGPSGPDRPPE
jgi:hypothetical protein